MNKLKGALKLFGGLLLIAAAALSLFNMVDSGRAGADADKISQGLTAQINTVQIHDVPDSGKEKIIPGAEPPTASVDNTAYIGVLELPDLALTLPVAASWNYSQLQFSPCRYSGSPYENDFVICAHNYGTHFGAITGLTAGAEAIFTDMDGRRFTYRLSEREIVEPSEGVRMTDSGYPLTLFTCNWNGSARVTLRFDRSGELS